MEYAARVQCPVGCVLDQGLFRENALVSNAMNRMAEQAPAPQRSSSTIMIVLVVICATCVLCSVGAIAMAYMYRDKLADSMGYTSVDDMYESLGLSFLLKKEDETD